MLAQLHRCRDEDPLPGQGRAEIELAAHRGALLHDRRPGRGRQGPRRRPAAVGPRLEFQSSDVSDPGAWTGFVDHIQSTNGRLHGLVNNAGSRAGTESWTPSWTRGTACRVSTSLVRNSPCGRSRPSSRTAAAGRSSTSGPRALPRATSPPPTPPPNGSARPQQARRTRVRRLEHSRERRVPPGRALQRLVTRG